MDLSILIPARNEEFLQKTIDDIFEHARGNTEVLVAIDNWFDKPEGRIDEIVPDGWGKYHLETKSAYFEGKQIATIPPNKQGQIIFTKLGQRGATNALAKLSTAKYVMKLDAHCSMSTGFDVELMKDAADDTVIVPALHNLHAYDWMCENGHRHFQGKYETCEQCGSTNLHKDITWKIIPKPSMAAYYFDTALHFQYSEVQPDGLLIETMSIQGSCFMAPREMYWNLSLCDEAFGSWGQQGTEVACKAWLSGGRVLSTRKAFYGHQFRETEGFPYLNPVEKIFAAQSYSRDLFLGNKWPLQKHSMQWLIEKFGYQGDWTPEKVAELCAPVDNALLSGVR